MNAKLSICVLVLLFGACIATEWKDIRSPMESPYYQEIVSKLIQSSDDIGTPISPKITGGAPASIGQFPFQVYMYLYRYNGGIYLCGGSVSSKT